MTEREKVKTTGTLVEDEEGKILVLKRSTNIDPKKEPGTFGLPAGLLRPNTTPNETAVIKLHIEVGIKVDESELESLGTYVWYDEVQNKQVEFNVFRLKIKGQHPEIIFSDTGHDSYLWEKPQQLFERDDLMMGMYHILPGVYKLINEK